MKYLIQSAFKFFYLFLIIFISNLLGENFDEEDIDCEEESQFCYSRYAFPATCPVHFSNNLATTHTWMEADDSISIDSFSDYFNLIPKIYEADCMQCHDCGGVRFNMYRGCDYPTDDRGFDELVKAHRQNLKHRVTNCSKNGGHCEDSCWYGGYFRLWNHKYLHFFKHYLQYCSENPYCECYWPEYEQDAVNINNFVYRLCKNLADDGFITPSFSSYWSAKTIQFDYHHGKIYTDLYYPNSHGMASSLTTYTFFYSQYHQMLLNLVDFIDSNSLTGDSTTIDRIYKALETIRRVFIDQYNMCIRFHPHPKLYYERGMLHMHFNNIEDAFMDINRLIRMAKTDKYQDQQILNTETYHQEGQLYLDLGIYDKAIASLTEAIRLDPNNRGAYFSRAQVFFENGQFEQAIDDYLLSKSNEDQPTNHFNPSTDIQEATLKGLKDGCEEAIIDFFPSLFHSIYGLGTGVWVFAQHPVSSTKQFVNACCDMSKNIKDLFYNIEIEEIESYPKEIQHLYDRFDRQSEVEKGYFIGKAIGKYGIDIFAGGASLKSISAFKKLRQANRVCLLETISVSAMNEEAVVALALKHQKQREAFFVNVKLHIDRQNKHVPGKHNYIQGRSIFEHSDPQNLINKFAGKGRPLGNRVPGCTDYREKVNFGEFIGYHLDKHTQKKSFTTWGEIRYSKDGAHIIPSLPDLEGL